MSLKLTLSVVSILFCLSPLNAGTLNDQLEGNLVQLENSGGVKHVPQGSLTNKTIIALYYSAHWCPPCRQFTPSLATTPATPSKGFIRQPAY